MFAGLVFGYHLFRYSFASPSQHSVTVNFNFDGVEKGIYPNGAVFSPNGLVSNNVLRRVFDELRLAGKEIEFLDFASALTIKPGFSGEDLLKSSAAEIASKDKNITVEAFNKLVATYTRAINTYSRQNAVLTLDNEDLDFGKSQAKVVLLKIPEVWAEYSIQELGVMVVFIDIVTVNVKKGLGVEPLVMVNKLSDYLNLLTGLTAWAQVNGRDELPIPQKVALDIEYLNRQSFGFDLYIIWLTFIKVIRKDGVSH